MKKSVVAALLAATCLPLRAEVLSSPGISVAQPPGGGGGGVTGGACTNKAVTAISTLGVPTCTTIGAVYVDATIGQTGNANTWSAPQTFALGTIAANQAAIAITQTWNSAGTTFDAPLFENITNTASAAGSLLEDLQVGGVSQFTVDKGGNTKVTGNLGVSTAPGTGITAITIPTFDYICSVGGSCLRFGSGGSVDMVNGGNSIGRVDGNGVSVGSNGYYCFTSAIRDATTGCDTGISREAADVTDVGNGITGDKSGTLKLANITATGTAVVFSGLTTGANADTVCFATGGTLLIQASTCTISSKRFKDQLGPLSDDALGGIDKIPVGIFRLRQDVRYPNADPNARSVRAGAYAEDVAKIMPKCAIYETDMKTPKSYDDKCMIGYLIRGEQQLLARIAKLEVADNRLRHALGTR